MNADPPFLQNCPFELRNGMNAILGRNLSDCKLFFTQNNFFLYLFITVLSFSLELLESKAVEISEESQAESGDFPAVKSSPGATFSLFRAFTKGGFVN
jgi:hypothetical protein